MEHWALQSLDLLDEQHTPPYSMAHLAGDEEEANRPTKQQLARMAASIIR